MTTGVVLNRTDLEVTDAGGTITTDLSLVDDADADPTNELTTGVVLNGTDLEVTDAGGTITTDLSSLVDDADADPTNEFNATVVLNGWTLGTDAGEPSPLISLPLSMMLMRIQPLSSTPRLRLMVRTLK